MTHHQSTRWPISTILFLTVLFLCADFSQSFAMTASASKEEKEKARGADPSDAVKAVKKAENDKKENQKILRNKVIHSDFLDGDPDIYTPSLFLTIPPRKITADKEKFDEAMKALAESHGCIRDTSNLSPTWDIGNNWSVGPAASAQLLRYETKSGKAALNALGLGLGLSARFYSDDNIDAAALVRRRAENGSDWEAVRSIRRVHPDCRVSTFELTKTKEEEDKFYAKSAMSFGVFAFVSKEAEKDTLNVDPAFTVGFLQDLLTFGVGINTHGQNRGHAFLLLGLGAAFSLGGD